MPDPDFRLIAPLRFHRDRVHARGELTFLSQLGISSNLCKLRIHVLHTGHAQRRSVFHRGASSAESLFMRHWRNRFVDQRHCRILENAGGIPVCVPHNDSTGDLRSFRINACELHRGGIRERLVTIVTLNEHWSVTCE